MKRDKKRYLHLSGLEPLVLNENSNANTARLEFELIRNDLRLYFRQLVRSIIRLSLRNFLLRNFY